MTTSQTKVNALPKKAKIFIVGGNSSYNKVAGIISSLHEEGAEIVENHNHANLIVFTGGEDVSPVLYKAKEHSKTHSNLERDTYEIPFFHFAKLWNIPMIGICRGSQLLTVLNGGTLIQHVSGHANGKHPITLNRRFGGLKVIASSTHHQMMCPFKSSMGEGSSLTEGDDYEIVAKSSTPLSSSYERNNNMIITQLPSEPEIVWYKKSNALAIQSHPETQLTDTEYVEAIKRVIKGTIYSIYK